MCATIKGASRLSARAMPDEGSHCRRCIRTPAFGRASLLLAQRALLIGLSRARATHLSHAHVQRTWRPMIIQPGGGGFFEQDGIVHVY